MCFFLKNIIVTPVFAYAPYRPVWEQLLSRHVQRTQTKGIETTVVDYQSLTENPSFLALIRYFESSDIPASREEQFWFWLDTYCVLLVKAVGENPELLSTSRLYTSPTIRVSGQLLTLQDILKKLTPLSSQPIQLVVSDGSIGSPDFPKTLPSGTPVSFCDSQAEAFIKNPSKGIRIEPNTRFVYISQYLVDTLGPSWQENPIVKDTLRDINRNDYTFQVLTQDHTPNRSAL